jgi:hypothetical protein
MQSDFQKPCVGSQEQEIQIPALPITGGRQRSDGIDYGRGEIINLIDYLRDSQT